MATQVVTIFLLTDPQMGMDPLEFRRDECSKLNSAINKLVGKKYPNIPNITCAGQDIKPNCVFLAGDLTQFGGNTDAGELAAMVMGFPKSPADHRGGPQLRAVQALYDGWRVQNDVAQLNLAVGPLYFGLGNHDLENGDNIVGWQNDLKPKDYYRYQMFNFINQMHTGWDSSSKPRWSVPKDNIDNHPGGSFDWKKYSFNYFVNLGPVDVYQLHRYGGDHDHDRASGINWLKNKLQSRGYLRPVVIVQHFLLSEYDDGGGDANISWNKAQRDHLLEVLLPYNVVAFLCGHDHNRSAFPPPMIKWRNERGTISGSPGFYPSKPDTVELHPGCAFGKHMGIIRIEAPAGGRVGNVTVNALYGTADSNNNIAWDGGWSQVRSMAPELKQQLYVKGLEVVTLQDNGTDSFSLPTVCPDVNNTSPDLHLGFGGNFMYLRLIYTTNPAEAITNIRVLVQDNGIAGRDDDIAKGRGGKYRYIDSWREADKKPITGVFLLRSDTAQGCPPHYAGITEDINKARGKTFLYLIWRDWTGNINF